MSQQAYGVVGAVVGGVIGYYSGNVWAGVQYGYAIGSGIGATQQPNAQGPRLSDLRVQISSYGAVIPIVWGGDRIAGNVVWAAPLIETISEEGGKGGGGVDVASYAASCAVLICEGPILGVRKIWADAKLIYNLSEDATAEEVEASVALEDYFVLYLGDEAQLPDPTIEAAEGVGTVEPMRGTAYIVWTELPVGDYGNRIPSFSFEIAGAKPPVCVMPQQPSIEVRWPGPGVNEGSLVILFSTEPGVSNTVLRIDKYEVETELPINPELNPGVSGDTVTPWKLGDLYRYVVLATNECGTAMSNIALVTWYGHFNGAKSDWNSPAGLCAGLNGYGANVWGDRCYILNDYGYAGTQIPSWIEPDISYSPRLGPTTGTPRIPEANAWLDEIVADICARAGYNVSEDIDVSQLEGILVQGYKTTRLMNARAALEPLRACYYFDAVENGTVVEFVLRGNPFAATITRDELGAEEGGKPGVATLPTRGQETDLPREVNVVYPARLADYQPRAQQAQRQATVSVQTASLDIPVVITDQKAAEVADVVMYDIWSGRIERKFKTSRARTALLPTDNVIVDDGEYTYRCRITQKVENGPVIEWTVRDLEPSSYSPNSTPSNDGGNGGGGGSVPIVDPLEVELMNLPLLRDQDENAGFYAAGHAASFKGGFLFSSLDDSVFSTLQEIKVGAVFGRVVSVLPPFAGGNVVDGLSWFEVNLESGTLSSITRAQLLSGLNVCLVGDEIVSVGTAVLQTGSVYRCSRLLRGRRGTEAAIGTHDNNERFVLLTPQTVYRISRSLGDLGPAFYRAVTYGSSLDDAESESFTNTGRGLAPLSVSHLAAVDLGDGDYRIQWKRRGRIGQEWRDLVDVPLGEASQAFRVDHYRASVLLSSTDTAQEYAVLTALADDVVVVRQLSALVGPGEEAEVTLR